MFFDVAGDALRITVRASDGECCGSVVIVVQGEGRKKGKARDSIRLAKEIFFFIIPFLIQSYHYFSLPDEQRIPLNS